MLSDIFRASRIVKNESDIESVGIDDFVEETSENFQARMGVADEFVEFVDATERVFVCGIAVEEFVLNQAIEGAEFRKVSSEEADAMHLAKGFGDLAFAFEDGLEGITVCLEVAERFVDIVPMACDESSHLRRESEIAQLAMLEQAHHAVRIVFENFLVFRIDPAVASDEAIELLAFFSAEGEEGTQPALGNRVLLDLEGFHDRVGVIVEVASLAVIVPHERFRAAENAAIRIIECGGDDALELEGKNVRGFACMIVKLVSHTHEKVVGLLDFTESAPRDDAILRKFA